MTLDLLLSEREIARALTRFARAMDARDWPELLRIMAADATGDLGTGPLASPQAVVDCIAGYLDACGATQHLLGNLLVEVDGDAATSRCYVSDMHLGPAGQEHVTFATLGDYHDRWARQDGVWRMVHRTKINRAHIGSLAVFGAAHGNANHGGVRQP